MTADILPFPPRGGPDHRQESQDARAARDAAHRRAVRELRKELSRRTGSKSRFPRKLRRDEDAIHLAQRLGSDLESIKKSGRGHLSTILVKARQTLTTRARYALFSNETPGGKRVRKLEPYVFLSDAIADHLRQDRDLYLYEKLDGLNVLNSDQSIDDPAAELSLFIDQMAKNVSEKTKIADFFDLAADTLGNMDENGQISSSNDRLLCYRPYDGWPDFPDDPRQPIPLVPIFRMRERSLPGRARIAPWVEGRPQNLSDLFPAVDDAGADVTDIFVEIWREFSLTICECGWPSTIRPMFAGRPQIQVLIGDIVAHHPVYPWTAEPFYSEWDGNPVPLTDGRRWTVCRPYIEIGEDFSDNLTEPKVPPDSEGDTFLHYISHYYFTTHPVNVWNVRRLLDVCPHISHVEGLLPDIEDEAGLKYRLPGVIGQRFEAALYTGRLEVTLSDAIERLKGELARYRLERRAALAAQDDVMLARWRPAQAADIEEPGE